ncbi:MAG TPA: calcium-binding protein [Polyangiaceae bacterium]|nr:calcium-binding protein [Polyangiaceae bacterium]
MPATLLAACSSSTGEQQSAQVENTDESAAALGVQVASCSDPTNSGFTASTGALALSMGSASSLVMGVVNGYVTVNGYACVKPTNLGGGKLTPTVVKKVSITGTANDDKVVLDTLSGNLGAMISAAGGITIDMAGGTGDQFSLRGSNSADKWTAGEDSGNEYFEISGDKFADVVVKNAEKFAISLSGGADTFTAQGGAITATNLAGGSSLTSLGPVTVDLTINGGDGDDVITGGNGDDTIDGGNGNDTYKASALGDGDDTFTGGAGEDKADYSARTTGQDLVIVMDGATTGGDVSGNTPEADVIGSDVEDLVGGAGDDTLTGNSNSNHIQGGAGDDKISGGPGNATCSLDVDTLDGEAGDDTFDQGSAADCGDVMNGGPGTDRVDYQGRTNALTILLDTAANDGETGEKDNIKADVEIVIGGSGNDTITGSANADIIHGGPGDDVINAGGGNDTITGDSGNDTLNGEAGDDTFVEGGVDPEYTVAENYGDGNDVINGGTHDGTGVDTVDYSGRSADMTVTLCMDSAHLTGAASGNTLPAACTDADGDLTNTEADSVVNVTHLIGGTGNDTFTGSAADDILEGNDGDDTLKGGAGNDMLYGDNGDDTLEGDDGNDTLDSGAHTNADTLDGDAGGVNSGDGDVCIYDSTTDTAVDCEL